MWRSNEKLNSGFEYFGVEKLEFKISHYEKAKMRAELHIGRLARLCESFLKV